MRLGWFLIGVLVGLALAPAKGRTTVRMLRDGLARTIDRALRIGVGASS
ncbi:MAG TPA: YtxH domain-containing protein [Roseiflexaceae bacterium]|nr:YtxH domain-containing protein [Roseiflexaceae bacterium]